MPAPTNISAATATPLTPLPASAIQDVNFGGVTFDVWFSVLAPAGSQELAIFGFGDLVVYKPVIAIFDGPAGAPTPYPPVQPVVTAGNQPCQIPVTPGVRYWINVQANGGALPAAILNITARAAQKLSVDIGDQLSADDVNGLPGYIIGGDDGSPRQFLFPFPAGEAGDVLSGSGDFLVNDLGANNLKLFDGPTLTQKAVVALPVAGTAAAIRMRTCQPAQVWYVGNRGINPGTPAFANRVSAAGVIGPTIGPFPTPGLIALGANAAETILYFAGQGNTNISQVSRWNLTLNVALGDLVAAIPTYQILDILVLADDTILVSYWKPTVVHDLMVKHYSPAGATLATFTYGTINSRGTPPRLAYALDDPLSFWIWVHMNPAITRRINTSVVTGLAVQQFDVPEYTLGRYDPPVVDASPVPFGLSNSCAFFLLRRLICECGTPGGGGGHAGIPIGVGSLASLVGGRRVIPIGLVDLVGELDMIFGEERFVTPHENIVVSGAAQGFATITDEAIGMAIVTIEGDNIRWLVSGEAPTATDGNICEAGTVFVIANITNIRNFRCILAAGSSAAIVTGNFARA